MRQITTFEGTPEEWKAMMLDVISPLVDKIAELETKVHQRQTILTLKQVAADCGRSPATVRTWVYEGKTPPGKTKRVKLKLVDGLSDGTLLIHWDDYQSFIAQFPRIQAQ